jgi:twitching motility protein PilJ
MMALKSESGPKAQARAGSGGLPLIGRMPLRNQLGVLAIVLTMCLIPAVAFVVLDVVDTRHGAAYVADAGQLRMLSQRLAKASLQSLLGNPDAFKQVDQSRNAFSAILERLVKGGTTPAGETVPASPDRVLPSLEAMQKEWEKTDRNVTVLLREQKNLIGLGSAVSQVNGANPQLLDLAEQVQALKLQGGAGTREISAAGHLVMLTQRLAKNANALLAGESIDPEVSFLLGKDTNEFRTTLTALQGGSPALRLAPPKDEDTKAKLGELAGAFKGYADSVASILGNMQRLIAAKNAAFAVFNDSEKLLGASESTRRCSRSRPRRTSPLPSRCWRSACWR